MYTEDVFKRYPILDKEKPVQSNPLCDVLGKFCPLEIIHHNGMLTVPFSDAEIFVKALVGRSRNAPESKSFRLATADILLYSGMIYDLRSVPTKDVEGRRTPTKDAEGRQIKALNALKNIFANKEHFECIQKMQEDGTRSEKDVQEVLAIHLFKPLAMKPCTIKIDSSRYTKEIKERTCRYCEESEEVKLDNKVKVDNTAFGHKAVWHGYGDILVGYSVVKIQDLGEEDSEAMQACDEPAEKKMKVENEIGAGGDAGGSEVKLAKDDYMPNGPNLISTDIEGFKKPNKTLSQVLAQTIVNAFCQNQQNPFLNDYFIPTFLASEKHVTVHMYRPSDDTLLTQAKAMPIIGNGEFFPYTILCIWLALNMLHFPCVVPGQKTIVKCYKPSKFKTLAGQSLRIYQQLKTPCPLLSSNTREMVDTLDEVYDEIYSVSKVIEKAKPKCRR